MFVVPESVFQVFGACRGCRRTSSFRGPPVLRWEAASSQLRRTCFSIIRCFPKHARVFRCRPGALPGGLAGGLAESLAGGLLLGFCCGALAASVFLLSARCFCSLVRSVFLLLPCLCSAASALLFHVLWLCCAMIFLFLLFCFCPSASATCPFFSAHGLLLLLCCSCSSLSGSSAPLLLLCCSCCSCCSSSHLPVWLLCSCFFWCIGGS